jgi:hypothetical protein
MANVDKAALASRLSPEGLRVKAEVLRAPASRPDLAKLTALRPDLTKLTVLRPEILLRPGPIRPMPIPRPPPAPSGLPAEAPPQAPRTNPFADLPYRSPGDRILADDFNRLSQALDQLAQAFRLSSALFGARLGDARPVLEGNGYRVRRAVSVFGNLLQDVQEESAADRLVVSVSLVALGGVEVDLVLSERVEGRRFVPELRGRTYAQARDAIRNLLADGPVPAPPGPAPALVGSSLSDARNQL